MNEVTKIHLGRQAFAIAVDAYKALQHYLHAIERQTGTKDVVEEVELRMAELLSERGVQGDKVVLLKDVEYLKEQLGEPDAFGDDEGEASEETRPKRLFRDTQNGMIAGVCAGMAKYLNIDPVWIRLAFVGLVFLGASGILLYIVLWLIVPEAKTNSERLQMQGKPVNVDTIKEVVERADVKGAAVRAQHTFGKILSVLFKICLAILGFGLLIGGIMALLGITTFGVYWSLNHDFVPAGIFPVGATEVGLIVVSMLFAAILALFFLVGGLALVKRKWPLPGWALGGLVAVWLLCLAVGAAMTADVVSSIRSRYEAAQHTHVVRLPEFTKLNVVGAFDTSIQYKESTERSVTLEYWGDIDPTKLHASVKDQTLTLDSDELSAGLRCKKLCLFHSPLLQLTVRGPKLQEITTDMQGAQLNIPGLHDQTVKIHSKGSAIYMPAIAGDTVRALLADDGSWTFTISGLLGDEVSPQELSLFEDSLSMSMKHIDLTFDGFCGHEGKLASGQYLSVTNSFASLTINGKRYNSPEELHKLQDQPGLRAEDCVDVSLTPQEQAAMQVGIAQELSSGTSGNW